jgi:hypothetical protein
MEDDKVDALNYKGIFFNNKKEKYYCPATGAHFHFDDMVNRLKEATAQREAFDQQWEAHLKKQQ